MRSKLFSFKSLSCMAIALSALVLLGGVFSPANAEDPPVYVSQFGTFGTSNGQFNSPHGIAIDSSGNIFVVDHKNSRIQKFSSAGTYISQFGSYGTGNGQFNWPVAVAIDRSGNIWVTDYNNHRIQKFSSSGTYISQFGSYGTGNGQLNLPSGIVFDSSGNIYVTEFANHRVQKFDSNGTYLSQFGSYARTGNGKFYLPLGIAIDSSGNIWVADHGNSRIQKFDSNGTYLSQIGTLGSGNGQFNYSVFIAIDSSGNIWVTDKNNHRVQKFDSAGNYLSQFGTLGTGNGQFNVSSGIAFDSLGNIFVSDFNNHRIQKFGYTRIIGLSGSLAFGNVTVGSTSTKTMTISNTGNSPLSVSSISYSYPTVFSGNWSGTIPAGGSQNVTVTFAPTAAQSYSGTVTVNSDKTSGTETIAISGTGIQTYTVTFQAGANGTIAPTAAHTVASGSSTSAVTATASSGYQFLNWTSPGGFTSTANPLTVTNVTANMTITANFQQVNATSFVTRTLPTCYTAGTGLTVTLKATPPTGTLNYMVEDSPPAGWTVSNISSPGTYDSINKKVKFIFYDGSAQTFMYDVTPPVSETGDKNFAGTALKDNSARSDITGQAVISQCSPYHPADNNPANYRLTMEEVSAYITAWQKGTLWNGVRISGSYVSRAGGLWQNGETYRYDPAAGTPPMCWLNTTLRSVRDNASSVIRKMPAYYEAGKAITVSLEVTPGGSGLFYTIEETPPAGWTVSDVSSPGSFDETNKIVTFYGNQAKTWSYKLTPPAGATGTRAFGAKSWFNGAEVAVTGIASVSDTEPAMGDVNGDGKVDLADAILALQVVAGLNPPNVFSSADVNNDNKIGLEEVVYILQKVAGLR